ncbi:MAG: hypothetical protein ACOYWZ_01275 [Bacillota bacterium]
MLLLSLKEIKKDFGDTSVLKNISFDISTGDRIGLVKTLCCSDYFA